MKNKFNIKIITNFLTFAGLPCFVIKRSPIWWSGPGHRVGEH